MTLEELIALYEADKERYELTFGSGYARLYNRSDMSEIHRVYDERCWAIAIMRLSEMMPFSLDTERKE